ncbi:capsular polysaccharide biosynthesis protein/Flp pilus assembly protein TadD [Skermanella aerolata]|uniref:glycosyltransferase 61 family protein n=1 Tax=Skermanella aerolata TaxID=393310 RepID=UPI003D21C98A
MAAGNHDGVTGSGGIGAAELFERAKAYLLERDTAAADRLIRQARLQVPDDPAMAYLHGLCHTMAGAPADAAEAFETSLRLDPGNGGTALLLGRALRQSGRPADAARVVADLIRRHAGSPGLLNEVAADLLEQGDEPAAASLLEQALALAPNDPGTLHNMGVACARLGSLERAEKMLRRALDRQPAGSPAACASLAALAGVLATRGFPDEALEIARTLIGQDREPVHAWTVIGTAAARRRQGGDAVAAFLEAELLEPDNPNVLSNLATALDDAGRTEEATVRWDRLARQGHAEAGARIRLRAGAPGPGEAIRRLFPLTGSLPEGGRAIELAEVDLCVDQWHLIDGDRMALDLVFTPPLGKDNFVLVPGKGVALVRDDLPRRRVDRPVEFLGGTGNYYHWMLDTLPRLVAIDDGERLPLLVNRDLSAFHHRTLDLMGVDPPRLMTSAGTPALVRFAKLRISGLVPRSRRPDGQMDWMLPSVSADAARTVRERLTRGLPRNRGGGPRRILISRQGSLFRRCENEAAVAAIAARHGFVPVRLEELSFDAQAELFGGAEIVMGVHGAGFTNMLFAPPEALLIELHPAGHLPVFYRHLTGLMGQRHRAIPGTITQSLFPSLEYNWNFRVDPADVDLCLAEL